MSVGTDFIALIDDPETSYDDISRFLDALSPEERRAAIESVGGRRRQGRLFEIAGGGPEIALDDLIPDGHKGALEPVIFYGKNSLPTFSIFQKRFARSTSGDALVGYNHQTMSFATGPGYFTARPARDDERKLGTVAIDYTVLPSEKAEDWPKIKANAGLGKLVYGNMVDYLRPLAEDVYIGRAVKGGKLTDNYFLLAREALG